MQVSECILFLNFLNLDDEQEQKIILRLRLVMLKSQAFFKLVTKNIKFFCFFCFTLAKTKQISKIKKAKKPTLIGFFAYFKQKSQPKS